MNKLNRFRNSLNKDRLLMILSISFLILFSVTPGLTSTIYLAGGKGVYITFLFSIFCYGIYCRPRFSIYAMKLTELITFFILLIILFDNNYNLKENAYDQLFYLYTFFIVYILGAFSDVWHKYLLKAYIAFSLFFLIMTYAEIANPTYFINKIMPMFSEYTSVHKQTVHLYQGYIAGFTANPAINATILNLGLTSFFAVWMSSNKHKTFLLVCVLSFLITMFITGKRGPVLFAAGSLMYAYFVAKSGSGVGKFAKFIGILLFVVLSFYFIAQYIPEVNNTIDRVVDSDDGGDLTTGRLGIWERSLSFFYMSPIIGSGWDSLKYLTGINTHNVYLQLLCEVGIFGSFVFYAFFIVSFIHVNVAMIRVRRILQESPSVLIFSVAIQFFFLLYCLTGNPLYDAVSVLGYLFACSVGEYYYYRYQPLAFYSVDG